MKKNKKKKVKLRKANVIRSLPTLEETKEMAKMFRYDLKSMWYMKTYIELANCL